MKKPFLFTIFILLLQFGYPYSWESYGPEGIKATNMFVVGFTNLEMLIMSDTGFFLVTDSQSWEYFPYPAKDAAFYNNNTVYFVAGSGSYSDGIYQLDIESHEIEVVEYCPNPNFIKFYDFAADYYVGFEQGLLKSEDGIVWESVSFFSGRNCVGMEFYNEHMVVNTIGNLSHLFLSDDDGATWTESTGCPGWITEMSFCGNKLYGVFPDNSYSSGLWSSDDYGDNWVNEFYSVNMSDVFFDLSYNRIFVSWKNSEDEFEGIADYYPNQPPPGLIFLNEGLPDKNINKINSLILLGGTNLFVCTDSGVYKNSGYLVNIVENDYNSPLISVFPDPVINQATFYINLKDEICKNVEMTIWNNSGIKVDELRYEKQLSDDFKITWSKGKLPAGVYYLVLKTKNETLTEKFIIL